VKLGAFDIVEPIPQLNTPHALAVITNWLDAGHAASLVLTRLEACYGKEKLAALTRPGDYLDFTRYRPTITRKDGKAELDIPNASITYATASSGHDFIFLRLPEPHHQAEEYVTSIVAFLKYFGVKRYGLLGSFYDMMPYTRPVLVSGSASNEMLCGVLEEAGVAASEYEGPTTILQLVADNARAQGIETFSLVAHLPGYLTPEEDFRGVKRLAEAVQNLYELPLWPQDLQQAEEQEEVLRVSAEQFLEHQPQLKIILKQLEDNYDARLKRGHEETRLSPEVERFLKELDWRLGGG
jgi:predicted ATP-grasp superfamily ATP-dependent carboligase